MEKKSMNRWFYAVTGTVVLLFSGLVYAWSVLSLPIAREFPEWTRAQLSFTFTLTMIMFCAGCMAGGMTAGKVSAKVNLMISGALFFAGFLTASCTQSILVLYLGFGVLAGVASGLSYNAVMGTIMKWFPDKSGLISGILLMGFGIGSFIIGKVYQAFTPEGTGGFRISFRVFAVILLVVMVLAGLVIKKPPRDMQFPEPKTKKKNQPAGLDIGTKAMIKRPSFWMYYLWAVFMSMAGLVLVSQAGGIAAEAAPDINAGILATVIGLISIFNGIGRVCFGLLYDRSGHRVTLLTDIAVFAVVEVILLMAVKSHSFGLIVAGFIVGGFAYGAVTPMNSAIIRSFYGPTHYSMNFSIINTNLIFASFASTIAGVLYDRSGSFTSTVLMMMVVTVVGFIAYLGIRRP